MLRMRHARRSVLTRGCFRLLLPLLPTFNDMVSRLRARGAVLSPLMPPSRHAPVLHFDRATCTQARSDTRKSPFESSNLLSLCRFSAVSSEPTEFGLKTDPLLRCERKTGRAGTSAEARGACK